MREFASDMAAFQEGHRFEHISIKGISFAYDGFNPSEPETEFRSVTVSPLSPRQ